MGLVQHLGKERTKQFDDLCIQKEIAMKQKKNHNASFLDLQFITSSISTTLVLLLLGLVVFFVLAAGNLSVYVREHINFSIILNNDMQERDILRMQKALNARPFIRSTQYISKEQALREYIDETGTDPQEFVDYNPLSASIEIKLRSDYANTDSLEYIKERIGRNAIVKDIVYQQELIDAVNRNIGRISLWLLGLAALLLLISFALINNTIKLTIYSKRFLIHTMKLVGASWGFIRRPFLWRNFWIGFLAAVMADGLLWGAAAWVVTCEPGLVQVVTPEVLLLVSGVLLVLGVLITTVCALLSINKYLRMKASTLYAV